MNSKGFQLSTNFLVVIILSLVLFGSGMMLFTKVVGHGTELQKQLDEKTIQQLDNLMDDGGLVVAPRRSITINKGKSGIFPIAFWNELGTTTDFRISANANNPGISTSYIHTYNDTKNNERAYALVVTGVDGVASGEYYVDVQVEYKDNTGHWQSYDTTKRVYVVVP